MAIQKIYLVFFMFLFIFSTIYAQQQKINDFTSLTNVKIIEQEIKKIEKKKKLNKKDSLNLVILYHNLALYKKELKTTERAIEKIEKIYKKNKTPIITTYYGSTLTLIGRDSKNPVIKIQYVKKGLKYIDKAIEEKPDNLFIRMVRANNNLELPSFFKRLKYAIKDFEWIRKNFEKGKIKLQPQTMAEVYYKLGDAYKRTGKVEKAVKMWQKAKKISPESEYGKKAKEILEIFEE